MIENYPWQALSSKIKHIFLQKVLVERKHVLDFEHFLKEIDFKYRVDGNGGAIAPPIFLEIRKKVVFSTSNVSGLHE